MNHFDCKRNHLLLNGSQLIGSLFIIAGLFAIVSPFIFYKEVDQGKAILIGTTAMVIGWVAVSSYEGITFNFAEKKVKEYTSFCGIKVGEWSNLADIPLVKVVAHHYKATNIPNGISPTLSGHTKVYRVLLFTNHSTAEYSFTYSSKARAAKDARLLAGHLHAEFEISDLIDRA